MSIGNRYNNICRLLPVCNVFANIQTYRKLTLYFNTLFTKLKDIVTNKYPWAEVSCQKNFMLNVECSCKLYDVNFLYVCIWAKTLQQVTNDIYYYTCCQLT